MTEQTKEPLRYRAYFWLMNAAFVASVISWLAVFTYMATGVEAFGLPEVPKAIIGLFLIVFAVYAPTILLLARFMRDEYAEEIWRRTVTPLAYAAALVPLAYVLTAWASFYALGQPEDPPPYLAWASEEVTVGSAIWLCLTVYMQLFVFIFQFIRWRDLR